MDTENRGILHCCGKRLFWEPQEGTVVLEATCLTCGAIYAMDPGGDEEEDGL